MKPLRGFQYIHARSFEEAWKAVAQYPQEARFLAGGTDLLVKLKKGQTRIPLVISLQGIPGLHKLVESEDRTEIGALVTVGELVWSEFLRTRWPLLQMAAGCLGSKQIRNLATIGGNLCNGSPAADLSVALLCLQAEVEIKGPERNRTERVEDLFQGPGFTSLKTGEILATVIIPASEGKWTWNYQKLTNRRAMEIGTVNVAVGLKREKEICKEVRIALGAVAPTPIRARKTEGHLVGKRLDSILIGEGASLGAQESRSIDDIRASAAYRQEMVINLIRRALTAAWAKGEE